MHSTRVTLLERLRQPKDQAAWHRFVQLYTPLMIHWGRRLGLDGPDAEDLVQEVFTLLIKKLPEFQYDRGKRFRAWLWTVMLNKHRERARRPQVQIAADANLATLTDSEELTAFDDAEYSQYIQQRAMELIQGEFQPATWKAFWECVVSGRPPADVAAELSVSIDVVYTSKSRVLRRLRQDLDGLLD